MNEEQLKDLIPVYRDGLLNDVVPFWVRHGVDHEHGGFISSLGREIIEKSISINPQHF